MPFHKLQSPHLVKLCLIAMIILFPRLYIFILVWWIGSVAYSVLINTIKLPSDNDDPWTFSIVATTFILLPPSMLGLASTVDNNSVYSNKIIALCNVLNIWSVILGTLLMGGSATYYLKLAEPLVVLFFEILMNGRNSLTSKHATNGMISVILLIVFDFTARYFKTKKYDGKLLMSNFIIGAISIISVAIKVVLGAKRVDEKRPPGRGYALFLSRSSTGLKYIICVSLFAIFIHPPVLENMIGLLPALVVMAITQNIYNYASVEVNDRSLAGEYVNGKIIKRIIVLLALFGQSVFSRNPKERIVLFGAIGRHNFGDILMAEVFEKNLMNTCNITNTFDVFFADILPRNMTQYGGREVAGITSFMDDTTKTHVVHVGGQTGGICSIKCALTMFDPDPNLSERDTPEWKKFENTSKIAYIVKKSMFRNPGSFVTNTIGGYTKEADDILEDFDFVSTRDYPGTTIKTFAPDSVITIKKNFEDKILAHKPNNFSRKYIAVQFRRREKQIAEIVHELLELVSTTNYGVVFFRAGSVHDTLDSYEIIQEKLAEVGVRNDIHIFRGLNIWDITSIIANSELVIGTSLHVRIIAFAFAIPRVTFSARPKHESMINYWDYGAIECKIKAIQVDQIFETAKQTMACDAFKNEKYGHLALEVYMEMFQNMIHTMGICSGSNKYPASNSRISKIIHFKMLHFNDAIEINNKNQNQMKSIKLKIK